MSKSISKIFVVSLVALLLAACGAKPSNQNPNNTNGTTNAVNENSQATEDKSDSTIENSIIKNYDTSDIDATVNELDDVDFEDGELDGIN